MSVSLEQIGYNVAVREEQPGGVVRVRLRRLTTTCAPLTTNEVTHLLHTVSQAEGTPGQWHGFDYTLPFRIEGRDGFPYALPLVVG